MAPTALFPTAREQESIQGRKREANAHREGLRCRRKRARGGGRTMLGLLAAAGGSGRRSGVAECRREGGFRVLAQLERNEGGCVGVGLALGKNRGGGWRLRLRCSWRLGGSSRWPRMRSGTEGDEGEGGDVVWSGGKREKRWRMEGGDMGDGRVFEFETKMKKGRWVVCNFF